jgi:adenosylcobyric acid synthase
LERELAALMIQGCGSDVGKSVLVAGLCRLFANRGLAVRPFKSQNMSNNAAVTAGGGEIGRAQALQAQACRVAPTVDMNPVLLKPQSDIGSQLIVRGKMVGTLNAAEYRKDKRALLDVAVESFRRLEQEAELVIVEGAGSPAETNLRANDIANMGLAQALGLPVILVGDINRGHVIASLVGAHVVLEPADRALIRGFIINKFRGDVRLFDDGLRQVTEHTGWPSMGVVPWLKAAGRLPPEDGMGLDELRTGARAVRAAHPDSLSARVAVPQLSRIANFDEFDALREEPGVDLMFVPPGRPLPRDAALIVIPGTKSTIADLEFMRAQGWDVDILAHVRQGGRVLGICGGYQMLGRVVSDPQGIEGKPKTVPGLGLLDVETVMTGDKTLREVRGEVVGMPLECGDPASKAGSADGGPAGSATSTPFAGYEMHVGVTTGPGCGHPLLRLADGTPDGTPDGAVSADGRVAGCYVHGLFGLTAARAAFLAPLGVTGSGVDHAAIVDAALDEIAAALEECLDINALVAIAGI